MREETKAFIRMMKHPLKFRMFLFANLPAALFSGLRIRYIDEKSCEVSVPYKWFTRNPFRSTYFASLSMAAEMSTGSLCVLHLYKRKPPVSMLVVKVESDYFKKATGRTIFVCPDGAMIEKAIEETIASGDAKTVRVKSTGKNEAGEIVADFFITWSFKTKKNLPSG
jgi:predicted RNA-binding protein YlxR (DUF448 family)